MEQGINTRAVDFAKFGELYLHNGYWNSEQIISEKWVMKSTMPDLNDHRPGHVTVDWKNANGYYQYIWRGQIRPDGSCVYMA